MNAPTTDDLHRAYRLSRLSVLGYSYEQAMQNDAMKRAVTNTAKALMSSSERAQQLDHPRYTHAF